MCVVSQASQNNGTLSEEIQFLYEAKTQEVEKQLPGIKTSTA